MFAALPNDPNNGGLVVFPSGLVVELWLAVEPNREPDCPA